MPIDEMISLTPTANKRKLLENSIEKAVFTSKGNLLGPKAVDETGLSLVEGIFLPSLTKSPDGL